MADYIATRNDWDVATLALSVNMVGDEFSKTEFRDRASYKVDRIADANSDRPVVCLTFFPSVWDVCSSLTTVFTDPQLAPKECRDVLEDVVAETSHSNVHLARGTELLDIDLLASDLIHLSDNGTIRIGNRLGRRLSYLM